MGWSCSCQRSLGPNKKHPGAVVELQRGRHEAAARFERKELPRQMPCEEEFAVCE